MVQEILNFALFQSREDVRGEGKGVVFHVVQLDIAVQQGSIHGWADYSFSFFIHYAVDHFNRR